jgi:hypothetical protein
LTSPLIWTFDISPDSVRRMLVTEDFEMLISGFLFPEASMAPNGNPAAKTVSVSRTSVFFPSSRAAGSPNASRTRRHAMSRLGSVATTFAAKIFSWGVPLQKTTLTDDARPTTCSFVIR